MNNPTIAPPTINHGITPADAAIHRASTLPEGCPERVIIELLVERHATARSPVPWSTIDYRLYQHGIDMTKEEFQTTILARSRSSAHFIGSRLGNPGGYFLIWTEEDIRLCMCDADIRIRQMQRNRDNMDLLALLAGWERPDVMNHQFPGQCGLN